MINLLAVAFEPPPWLKASAAQQALAVFEREHWSPEGAALRMIVAPCRWWGAVEAIEVAARGMDAVLLMGAQRSETFVSVIETARNIADPHILDAQSFSWPGARLTPHGPVSIESTLDAEMIAAAFKTGGIAAVPRPFDDYVYNRALYGLIPRLHSTPVGLVRLPLSVESGRAEGRSASFNRLQIVEALRTALSAVAESVRVQRETLALAV